MPSSDRSCRAATLALTAALGLGACASAPRDADTLALRDRLEQGALTLEDAQHFRTSEREREAVVMAASERTRPLATRQDRDLMAAAQAGQLDRVKELLKAGALPGAADEWGQTALLLAAREGQVAVVRQLLRAGAQVEGDDSTLTPLAAAALRGHLPTVQVLLRAGARPDATGRGDQTPLILAIRHQHLPVVRELLAAGANTAVTDRSGDGPLVLAIRQDNLPLLDLLLRQGMDPNRPDADGLTPLYWARQEQRPALAQRLIEAGAKEALIRQALRPSRPYPKEND